MPSKILKPLCDGTWDQRGETVIDGGRGVTRGGADGIIAPLPEPMAEGGRGIPIMQRCTDMFSMRALPGGGTGVVLGLLRRIQENHAAS